MDVRRLDSNCTRHEAVQISQLIWPKSTSEFKKTCVFRGKNDCLYRLEAPTYYQTHTLGEGVSVYERLGGLDLFHTYTLWIRDTTRNAQGETLHHVHYATSEPMELNSALLEDMLASVGEPTQYASVIGSTPTWEIICKHLRKKYPPTAVRLIEEKVPYMRMRLSPRLFRLFSQKSLLDMPLGDFKELSKILLDTNTPEETEKVVARLSFQWLQKNSKMPTLDLEGLFALERHYRLGTASGMSQKEWDSLLLCVEFFQKSLSKNKANGHTYATARKLAVAYSEAIRWDARTKPTARHIAGEARDPHINEIASAIASHIPKAVRLEIIKVQVVPMDDLLPKTRDNMKRVIYAGDDWLMQAFCVKILQTIAQENWDRATHADGCRTMTDVLDRIADRQPPKYRDGPHWENKDFQKHWRTLDEQQQRAVVNAVLFPITFVTGPPGTGKTELFATLKHLFSGTESIALAAYGRIAKMVDERIGDAFTFHRAEATLRYRSGTQTAKRILRSQTGFIDEFGLATHEHLARVGDTALQNTTRLLFAGDVDQMGSIGSGSIIGSIYRRYGDRDDLFTTLNVPHRFLPKYGVGMSSDEIAAACATKPTDPSSPMSTVWNMAQIRNYPRTHELDLVFGEDMEARFVIVPEGSTIEETLDNLERIGFKKERLMSLDCQILTHTNKLRRDLNKAVRARFGPAVPAQQHRFGVNEKITFLKNKYFELPEPGSDEPEVMGDADINYQALRTAVRPGEKRTHAIAFDYSSENDQGSAKRQCTEKQNVFNGEVKVIRTIYDESKKGALRAQLQNTGQRVSHGCIRKLGFTDNTNLALADYDIHKIESAIAMTVPKYQGSEEEEIHYWYAESVHIRRDQLLTAMTRAKRRFVWIGGKTVRQALAHIRAVASADPIPRRERFAYHLNIEPDD